MYYEYLMRWHNRFKPGELSESLSLSRISIRCKRIHTWLPVIWRFTELCNWFCNIELHDSDYNLDDYSQKAWQQCYKLSPSPFTSKWKVDTFSLQEKAHEYNNACTTKQKLGTIIQMRKLSPHCQNWTKGVWLDKLFVKWTCNHWTTGSLIFFYICALL